MPVATAAVAEDCDESDISFIVCVVDAVGDDVRFLVMGVRWDVNWKGEMEVGMRMVS